MFKAVVVYSGCPAVCGVRWIVIPATSWVVRPDGVDCCEITAVVYAENQSCLTTQAAHVRRRRYHIPTRVIHDCELEGHCSILAYPRHNIHYFFSAVTICSGGATVSPVVRAVMPGPAILAIKPWPNQLNRRSKTVSFDVNDPRRPRAAAPCDIFFVFIHDCEFECHCQSTLVTV